MSTLTLIDSLPVVSTLSLSLSQIIINETSANNTLSRMTVGNFASQFLPTGPIISNAGGTIAALDLDPLLEISSIGSDGLGTLTFNTLSAGQLIGNPSPSTGHVVAGALTTYMDSAFGSVEGEIVYRGASTWTALSPGTAGHVLTTGGTGAAPSWGTPSAYINVSNGTTSISAGTLVISTGLTLTTSGSTATLTSGSGGLPSGTNGQVLELVSGAAAWVSQPVDFDTYSSTVAVSQVLLQVTAQRTLTFSTNCFKHILSSTLGANFGSNIVAAGSSVGSITVTAGSTTGTSVSSAFTLTTGQTLVIVATTVGTGVETQGTATR